LAVALVAPGVATVHAQQSELHLMLAAAPAGGATAPIAAAVEEAKLAEATVTTKRRLRRVKHEELSMDLILASAELIKTHHKQVGTEVPVEISGKHYIARIERHFHPEGGRAKPWGYHPGVSLFVVVD
jgi:hypothetical protein